MPDVTRTNPGTAAPQTPVVNIVLLRARAAGLKAQIAALPAGDSSAQALQVELQGILAQIADAGKASATTDVANLTVEQRLARLEAHPSIAPPTPDKDPSNMDYVYGTDDPANPHPQGRFSGAPSPSNPRQRMLMNAFGNPINNCGIVIK